MENNKKHKLFSALWNLTITESLHTEEKTVDTRHSLKYFTQKLVNTITHQQNYLQMHRALRSSHSNVEGRQNASQYR